MRKFLRWDKFINQGIEIAKKNGKYKGRKKIEKPENWGNIYFSYLKKEITAVEAMKKLNLKKDTFYKFAKESNKEFCIARRPSKDFW